MRLTMVVRADFAAKANDAMARVDEQGGDRTFTVPLARPQQPTTPAAYWCSWDLAATGHDPQQVRQWLAAKGVPIADVAADGRWVDPQKRMAVYVTSAATLWTGAQVLADLGLQTIDETDTG